MYIPLKGPSSSSGIASEHHENPNGISFKAKRQSNLLNRPPARGLFFLASLPFGVSCFLNDHPPYMIDALHPFLFD